MRSAVDERVDPDGVPHVAGGVVLGDADGIEVVSGPLDFGPLEHTESHLPEGFDAVVHRLRDGVQAAQRLRTSGQGDVEGGIGREGSERIGAGGLATRFQLAFERCLQLVEGLAQGRSLLGRSVLEGAQAQGQTPILAPEPVGAPCLTLVLTRRLCKRFQRLCTERINLCFNR